jgi:hypothetical protein
VFVLFRIILRVDINEYLYIEAFPICCCAFFMRIAEKHLLCPFQMLRLTLLLANSDICLGAFKDRVYW